MTSPVSRGCVNKALFDPGVGPWICADANSPKAGGMVMKIRQRGERRRQINGSDDVCVSVLII